MAASRLRVGFKNPFGVSYPMWNSGKDRTSDFALMKELGISWLRTDAMDDSGWQTELGEIMTLANTNGIEVQLCLYNTLAFASAPTTSAVQTFAAAQATAWPDVRVWEVFNEPDLQGWTPATYVPYLQAAYQGIKSVNPKAIVSVGGLWKWPAGGFGTDGQGMVEFVKGIYSNGGRHYFDAVAIHAYGDPAFSPAVWLPWDYAFVNAENIRGVMDAQGDNQKPIWVNECGEVMPPTGTKTEDEHAAAVRNSAWAFKNWPLAAVAIFSLIDDTSIGIDGYSLVTSAGVKRKAYREYRDAIMLQTRQTVAVHGRRR